MTYENPVCIGLKVMRPSLGERNKSFYYIIRLSVKQNGMNFQSKVHSVNSLHCVDVTDASASHCWLHFNVIVGIKRFGQQ